MSACYEVYLANDSATAQKCARILLHFIALANSPLYTFRMHPKGHSQCTLCLGQTNGTARRDSLTYSLTDCDTFHRIDSSLRRQYRQLTFEIKVNTQRNTDRQTGRGLSPVLHRWETLSRCVGECVCLFVRSTLSPFPHFHRVLYSVFSEMHSSPPVSTNSTSMLFRIMARQLHWPMSEPSFATDEST